MPLISFTIYVPFVFLINNEVFRPTQTMAASHAVPCPFVRPSVGLSVPAGAAAKTCSGGQCTSSATYDTHAGRVNFGPTIEKSKILVVT